MYTVVSQLIVQAVGKIIGSSLDSLIATISRRRSLASKLINLFSCLRELEIASRTLHNDLLLVASGKEPVTDIAKVPLGRVIVQRSVQDFRAAVNDLSRHLKKVEAILGIYSRELQGDLHELSVAKGKYVKAIDLLLLACPQLKASDDLSTGHIIFPSRIPSRAAVDKILERVKRTIELEGSSPDTWTTEKIGAYNDKLTNMYLAEMGLAKAHIHMRSDVRALVERAETDIRTIERARVQLGDFIKTNLPLEKLLN